MSEIAIVGGGSSTFVPQLMRLFIGSQVLEGSTITLMDIDAERLEIMDRLCHALIEAEGAALTVKSTTDQRGALVNADFVIAAISVGGMDAWEADIEIPAQYGVYMTIGDSIGPGGIMRALRHIPVLASVAEDMAEVAPNAWLFNYSNPVTSIITALRQHRPQIKSVGLCTCASIPRNTGYLAKWAAVEPAEICVPAPAGGLNHCSFMQDVRLQDGRSALPRIQAHTDVDLVRWMLGTYGVVPYCWSHVTEFFPMLSHPVESYEGKLQGTEMLHGLHVHDMDEQRERQAKWARLVEEWPQGKGESVSLDVLPSAEAIEVVEIMEALVTNGNALHGVNVPNQGAIPNLPAEAIVEVTSLVNGYGIQPVGIGPLPEPLAATLRSHITAQRLTAQAGLSGNADLALQAFIQDPMTQARLHQEEIPKLMNALFQAHQAYLPQFA
jgi:alpha-galactosidase